MSNLAGLPLNNIFFASLGLNHTFDVVHLPSSNDHELCYDFKLRKVKLDEGASYYYDALE